MSIFHRFKIAGLVAALSLLFGACATSPPPQLEKARAVYKQAQQSNAAQYAPAQLASARTALMRAEKSYKQNGGDADITKTLSYIALRRSQEAMAQGRVNYLVSARKAKQNELVARTEQMHRELVRQRQLAQMNEKQLESKRQQLEQAQEKLQQQNLNAEQMRKRQQDYDAAIAKLNVEIQRRKQAEQQVSELQDRLNKVANVRQENRGTVITLDNSVLFSVGESKLLPNARQRLQQVANALKLKPDSKITIEGYTDSQGPSSLNQRLSEERADSVRDYLVSRGIDADRINTEGFGESRPIASNSNPEGRAMNRRVEIVVKPSEAVGGGPGKNKQMQNDQQTPHQQNEPEEPGEKVEPGTEQNEHQEQQQEQQQPGQNDMNQQQEPQKRPGDQNEDSDTVY